MTEQEWAFGADPQAMLPPFPSRASVRTVRMLAAACCRSFGSLLDNSTHPQRDTFLAVMEARADVLPSENWGDAITGDAQYASASEDVEGCSEIADFYFMIQYAGVGPCLGLLANRAASKGFRKESEQQAAFVRCVFGNPFRPITIDPSWLTSTVRILAQGIYEDRAFDRMPILADALQDAGCDSDDILGHCRDPHAAHARGRWVVDLVLGKA